MHLLRLMSFACFVIAVIRSLQAAESPARLRVLIETDAGGDPDDEQSLVRFLLYTNEWDVEGIIANRPEARDGENENPVRTGLGIVRRQLDAYAECYPLLVQHDPRYPPPDELRSRTVAGYPDVEDGVQLLIAAVDRDDPRPLWFCNWGTDDGAAPSCLRRALDQVLRERGPAGYARFKERIYLSSSDRFGPHTYEIPPAFPLWIDTFRPEVAGRRWYHRFSALTATAGGFDIERDCRSDHGPLGALYPTNTTHPQKEGDTMSFLYLVPTGMSDPLRPGWGSWAGRYGLQDDAQGRAYYWANVADAWQGATHREQTLARWAADLQNDFRARLDWCVCESAGANHPPVVQLDGPLERTLRGGETIQLDATASTDPDGDSLRFQWVHYAEATGLGEHQSLSADDTPTVQFTPTPADREYAAHLVLSVTDSGAPPLTRYARVILHVRP